MLERQQQQQVMMHGSDRKWTREDDKVFERALVMFPDSMPGRWVAIAAHMPGGRSDVDVWEHYKRLVHDVDLIDRGMVEMPNCWGGEGKDKEKEKAAVVVSATEQRGGGGGGGRGCMDDRKRGMPWTEEEHKLFLEGLVKYGKGDWRNISRWAVKTRTPTQVASHAQKYFIRQNQIANGNVRDSKRRSIHDVTNSNK